jgi:hypothetical protein
MTLSNVETFASLALAAASLNLLTFCCGVSPGGPGVRGGIEDVLALAGEDEGGGFAEACGVVGVNRVASMADLDIGILIDADNLKLGRVELMWT